MVQANRPQFEIFKSSVCHAVKNKGDIQFIRDVLIDNDILLLYEKQWYAECLYVLAMVDYLSRLHHVALCEEFDFLREQRLSRLVYPAEVAIADNVEQAKQECLAKAIPEFLHFNIVEIEVRNVC